MRVSFREGAPKLILYLNAYFAKAFDVNALAKLRVTIYRQKEIGNQASENLHHQTIWTACDEMINAHMAFPPSEKTLNVPSQFINQYDLLCG